MKLIALALLLGACTPVTLPLTPAGANVRLMKADPPAGCREIGLVIGESPNGVQPPSFEEKLELSKNDARNKAAESGANYVRWDTAYENGVRVSGVAFQCPPEPTTTAAAL